MSSNLLRDSGNYLHWRYLHVVRRALFVRSRGPVSGVHQLGWRIIDDDDDDDDGGDAGRRSPGRGSRWSEFLSACL